MKMGRVEKTVLISVSVVMFLIITLFFMSFNSYTGSERGQSDSTCWSSYTDYVDALGANALTYDDYESSYCNEDHH